MSFANEIADHLRECWFAICRSRDVKGMPVGFILYGTPIVLTRLNGDVRAFIDRCPHRNARLSAGKIVTGAIQCPYHGWQFDHDGECVRVPGFNGPAKHRTRSLTLVKTKEQDGMIWATFGSGSTSLGLYSPSWLGEHPHHSFIWQTSSRGNLANLIENFLDPTHTHFVHAGLIRRDSQRQQVRALVTPEKDRVEVEYTNEGKQAGLISRLFERDRSTSFGRFIFPSTAEIEYRSISGTSFSISAHFTPTDGDYVIIHAVVSVEGGPLTWRLKRAVAWPWFWMALQQDRKVVRAQRENIERFGSEQFTSTDVDLLGTHVRRMLNEGPYRSVPKPRSVDLDL